MKDAIHVKLSQAMRGLQDIVDRLLHRSALLFHDRRQIGPSTYSITRNRIRRARRFRGDDQIGWSRLVRISHSRANRFTTSVFPSDSRGTNLRK